MVHTKDDTVKPEVKKIPKRPDKEKAERKGIRERGRELPSRAPIELRSRSLARKPQDSRADSAQASKGKGKVTAGAKRFLTRAVLEAAKDVGRRAKKQKPPPQEEKEKSHLLSPGSTHMVEESDSGSNLDFLGSLATSVDTIVWATVDSGAATSCLPKEMCKNLGLAVKPVVEKPLLLASQLSVHGTCSPMVTIAGEGRPTSQRSGAVQSNGCGKASAVSVQAG